jgi:hypothetical protein
MTFSLAGQMPACEDLHGRQTDVEHILPPGSGSDNGRAWAASLPWSWRPRIDAAFNPRSPQSPRRRGKRLPADRPLEAHLEVVTIRRDFVEIFPFGVLKAEPWYEILNAGFRVTGSATASSVT